MHTFSMSHSSHGCLIRDTKSYTRFRPSILATWLYKRFKSVDNFRLYFCRSNNNNTHNETAASIMRTSLSLWATVSADLPKNKWWHMDDLSWRVNTLTAALDRHLQPQRSWLGDDASPYYFLLPYPVAHTSTRTPDTPFRTRRVGDMTRLVGFLHFCARLPVSHVTAKCKARK